MKEGPPKPIDHVKRYLLYQRIAHSDHPHITTASKNDFRERALKLWEKFTPDEFARLEQVGSENLKKSLQKGGNIYEAPHK